MKHVIRIALLFFILCGQALADITGHEPGTVVGRNIFGLATDVSKAPLLIFEKALIYDNTSFEQHISKGKSSFIVSGFDDALGGLYLSRYDADNERLLDTESFELSGVDGLSKPTGGIVTGWGSVLFSESQLADASRPLGFIDDFKPFYKGEAELVKPYRYGWVAEAIILTEMGDAKVIKNYSIGRVSASRLQLMPDNRSLYLHDAENTGALYLYVAKDANTLADGTLYGVTYDDGQVAYTELGSASALKMKFKLKKMRFDSLFDKESVSKNACKAGFTLTSTVYGDECLKLNKRNQRYAGLFEPVRTMAMLRKGRAANRFDEVVFDGDKGVVSLQVDGGPSLRVVSGNDEEIGSSYVIREVLK